MFASRVFFPSAREDAEPAALDQNPRVEVENRVRQIRARRSELSIIGIPRLVCHDFAASLRRAAPLLGCSAVLLVCVACRGCCDRGGVLLTCASDPLVLRVRCGFRTRWSSCRAPRASSSFEGRAWVGSSLRTRCGRHGDTDGFPVKVESRMLSRVQASGNSVFPRLRKNSLS